MERTIIQQIVAGVEPKYLLALRQPGTDLLHQTIPQILEHLFDTYGDVRILQSRVENLAFPIAEPVDMIFTKIDKLAAIAEIVNSPISQTQKINMAYLLFQKCHLFKNA